MRITFVEPYATVDGQLSSPMAKDVYSFFPLPGRAVDLLTAICRKAGYTDTVSLNLQYTGIGRRVWDRLEQSDVVGISAITRTAPPAYELADRVREINPKALVLFGGPHTTALPAEALVHGDVVILREGDRSILELLERLREGSTFHDVTGIAFRDGDEQIVTPPRPFLSNEEFNALPFPSFPPEVLKGITNQVMITSRGCPHGCKYCAVIENFGRRYRSLTPERMLEYYRHLLALSRKDLFIGDDNFTANPSRIKKFCELVLTSGLDQRGWAAQVRVEAGRDPELLDLMKRAGCHTVMIGLESVNNETLKLWNKCSSSEKNREAVEAFNRARISVHGMFVLGSEADTEETVKKTILFAKRLNLATAQFFPITPLPGTPLTNEYNEAGHILSKQWHLYDGQHVLVDPGRMNAAELQRGVIKAHREFYTWREGIRHLFLRGAQQRLYRCIIRFAGKRLTRKICRDSKPHLKALDRLEQWKVGIKAQYEGLQNSMTDLAASLTGDLVQRKEKILYAVDDWLDQLREDLQTLKKEYHPHCRQLIERLRTRLLIEADAILVRVSPA